MTAPPNDLTSLAKLISDSVAVVTSEYARAGHAPPTLESTAEDPFQSPESVSERLKTAIKTIEAACAQLSATVVSPGHVVTNKSYNFVEPVCMRVALHAKITDLLLDKPEGVHVEELGRLSDQDPGKLGRVLRTLATNNVYTEVYPWGSLPPDSIVVDVGGGNGHATLALLKAFPALKIIVQDTGAVAKQGRDYWEKEYPIAIQEQRVDFVGFDFLTEAPVAGGAVYYLRHVLHDWPDDDCVKILKNVRKAVGKNGKLLINEFVLQYIVRGGLASNTQAPAPLLPNYGAANRRLYQQDMNMMIQFNSKERTLEEFVNLGETSGFHFQKLWDGGEAGIVEFAPA
ncbi:hypothetical protein EYR40_002780 [Pleurotus pulmonarius]|nr:hypothetical protein EYR40_002780 [Pleurotus pulmonarius]KAF4582368.1 hypothetical protein EYR38_002486 [Pleurotus pulmonarius]